MAVDLTTDNLITLISIVGSTVAGWAIREFTVINKKHDDLSKDVDQYMHENNKNITDIKVNIGKIQTSISSIEEMIKRG